VTYGYRPEDITVLKDDMTLLERKPKPKPKSVPVRLMSFQTQWEKSDWLRVNPGRPEVLTLNAERFKNLVTFESTASFLSS
jgi:hypothetical protein